jgi:hypothetical protein
VWSPLQQNPVSLAGLPDFRSMPPYASRLPVAVACLAAGLFVGLLCLGVSVIAVVVGPDRAIALPVALPWELAVAFGGVGAVGALPAIPFAFWLSDHGQRLAPLAPRFAGAALSGAIAGEWYAPLVEQNPYTLRLPGVLIGAFVGVVAAVVWIARVSRRVR